MTNIILNGTAAVPIQQVTAAGFSLQNTGPGNVYLDNNASVSPSSGYVVSPGVSLPLNDNIVLYACTDVGQTATVQLLQGATATQATIVEANVPGAINANITNPSLTVNGTVNANVTNASIPVTGSVNATITNANIPVSGTVNANITNATIPVSGSVAISSGNVAITSGNVSVNGTVGSQAGAGLTLLSTSTASYTTAAGSFGIFNGGAPYPSAATYASLLFVCFDSGSLSSVPAVGTYLNLTVVLYNNTAGSAILDVYNPQWLAASAPATFGSLQVPLRGGAYSLSGSLTKPATASAGTLSVAVYGSHEIIPATRYESLPSFTGTPVGGVNFLSATVSTDSLVASKNGPANYNVLATSSSSTGSANIQYAENGVWNVFDGTGALPTGGRVGLSLNIPMRPILMHLAPTASGLIATLQQPN